MRKLLKRVSEVSEGNKSTNEKLDEGRKGGAEPEVSDAQATRGVCWMLQCLSDGEGEPPREEILKELGITMDQHERRLVSCEAK